MEGESEAIRMLDWRIRIVQAQIAEFIRLRDYQQAKLNELTQRRAGLWRERRLQRVRERKAAGEAK